MSKIARALAASFVLTAWLSLPAWGQFTGGPTGPIYYSGGNVGIGVTSPSALLHVFGSSGNPKIMVEGGSGALFPLYQLVDDRTGASNWNIENGRDGLGVLGFHTNFTPGGTRMIITPDGKVGIATLNPTYQLTVNGTIAATEVMVTNSIGADYVFRPGYRLRPLSEVNTYIQTHHHLPDIPSETEVRQKGLTVGDMETKLLAKVEELTLHLIRQEKENQDLRERIGRLEKQVATAAAR